MLKQFFSKQFLLFIVSGGIAASVNFSSRMFLDQWLSYNLSIIIAYCIGMVVAFTLFRNQVFHPPAGHSIQKEVLRFLVVNGAAILQTLIVSNLLARWLLPGIGWQWYPESVAHLAGISVPVITSYLGHKYLTFDDTTSVK